MNIRLIVVGFLLLSNAIAISAYANKAEKTMLDDWSQTMRNLEFAPATNDKLYCHIKPRFRTSNEHYPHADYLRQLASSQNIIVFVHGFIPDKLGGEHRLNGMINVWQEHIRIADEFEDVNYCVITWDTEYGHDDKNLTLGKLLSVLYMGISDNRNTLSHRQAKVTLVGHSAGGNYIKYSEVFANKMMAILKQTSNNFSKIFRKKIVTLGTPHLGTTKAESAQGLVLLGKVYAILAGDKNLNLSLDAFGLKAYSRGADRLRPVANNPPLRQLNNEFIQHFPKRDLLAIGSPNDELVPLSSAIPAFAEGMMLNLSHSQFLNPISSPQFYRSIQSIYRGGQL